MNPFSVGGGQLTFGVRRLDMSREQRMARLWHWLFVLCTAVVLGYLSGLLFGHVTVNAIVVALVGLLWAVVPLSMGALASRLAAGGKLPGTKRSA